MAKHGAVDHPARMGLRNYWYPIYLSADLGSAPVGITRLGEDLVLWRDAVGSTRLFLDRCAHRGVKLSLGNVHGSVLQCGYHGWQYDVEGRCTLIPTEGRGCTLAERAQLRTYPSAERGGFIWAYLGEDAPPPLDVPEELENAEWNGYLIPVTWNVNWLLFLDNLADPTHGRFLHAPVRRLSEDDSEDRIEVTETEAGLISQRRNPRVTRFEGSVFHPPNVFRFDTPYPPSAGPGGPLRTIAAATPIDEHSSAIFFARLRHVRGWKWWVWRATWRLRFQRAARVMMEQDRQILESQRGLSSRAHEHLVGSDQGVVRLRRLLGRLASEPCTPGGEALVSVAAD